jgi:hypothetical protein
LKDQDIIEPKQLRDREAKMSSTVQVQAWKESFCIGVLDDEHQDSMTGRLLARDPLDVDCLVFCFSCWGLMKG